MVQGIASFMGGSTREQQLRQQSKEKLLNTKTPIQKRRERRAGLKGGEGADSGIGKFATQLTLGAAPGAGYADMLGVFPDVEGGYEPSMLVNLQQAKRSFQEGNYKQAAAQGIFGALQGLGGAADTTLASAPFLGPAAPIAVKVGVGGKVLSSVGKKLVQKFIPKKINLPEIGNKINEQKQRGLSATVGISDMKGDYVVKGKEMKNVRYSDYKLEETEADKIMQEERAKHKSLTDAKGFQKRGVSADKFNVGKFDGVTMYTTNVVLKPDELKGVKGYQGEEKRLKTPTGKDSKKLKNLKDSIAKEGYKPYTNPQIVVNHKGEPFVLEGNHRIQEAIDSGRPAIAVDIKYLTTGYRADGPLNPQKLIDENPLTEADLVQHQKLYDEFNFAGKKMQAKEQARYEKEKGIASLPTNNLDEIKNRNPKVDLDVFEEDKGITLSSIKVKEENQKQGFGSQALNDLVKYADENNKIIALSPDVSFGKMSKKELKDFYKKFDFVENKGQNKNFSFRETMIRNPKGIAALPTEQGATTKALDIETKIQPKGEIRSQGGFNFSKEVTQKNLQLHRTRLNKLKQGLPTAGEPKNKRIVLKSDNPDNPDFAIGKINFDDWIKRAEKVLSDDEIKGAANWYSDVYDYFKKAPYIRDEQEAKNLAQAWFAGAQRKSPQKALANVLSIRSLLRQGKTPEEILAMEKIPEGGLEGANKAILSVLTGREASGVGFKISDFRDSLDNKNVRAVMDNEPIGGQPFTVDVHTARDMGLVDPALLNLLKNKGYKIPDNILSDFGEGGLSNDLYQNRAIFGSELTEHLNDIKWKGKDDWQPAEIQAIGWTTLTNLYGGVNTAGNIRDALNLNIQRISMEVKPGDGSPWAKMFGKDYSELPIQEQIKINDEITNEAITEIAKSENVDLFNNVFGTGGWQTFVNPSTVQEVLGIKSEAIRLGAKLGYVLNQEEIYINASKSLTKNPQAYTYDLIERNTNKLRDSKYINDLFTKIYEKTDGVIVGFQPIETIDNKVGIRMIVGKDTVDNFYKKRKIPKKGNEAKKNQFFEKDLQKMMNDVINDVNEDFDLYTSESDLTVLRNDWTKEGEKDGQNYKQYFSEKTLTDATAKNDRVLNTIRQKLTDSFREKIRRAQGVKAPNEEVVEIIEDIPPIDKKAFGGFVESSNYDHYRII